jgi:phosphonate transport system substrate-binding protein
MGETGGFFGEVVEAGFHDESIRMVADGEVDASAIDSQVLEVGLRDDPALRRSIRVIDVLGPSTIQPVAVSKRVPADLREDIRRVLLSLGEDPSCRERLGAGLVDRFVAVDPASYDDIRTMVDACEAAGFMQIR